MNFSVDLKVARDQFRHVFLSREPLEFLLMSFNKQTNKGESRLYGNRNSFLIDRLLRETAKNTNKNCFCYIKIKIHARFDCFCHECMWSIHLLWLHDQICYISSALQRLNIEACDAVALHNVLNEIIIISNPLALFFSHRKKTRFRLNFFFKFSIDGKIKFKLHIHPTALGILCIVGFFFSF